MCVGTAPASTSSVTSASKVASAIICLVPLISARRASVAVTAVFLTLSTAVNKTERVQHNNSI